MKHVGMQAWTGVLNRTQGGQSEAYHPSLEVSLTQSCQQKYSLHYSLQGNGVM